MSSVKVPPNCQVVITPPLGAVSVNVVIPLLACKYLIVPLLSITFTDPPSSPNTVFVCLVKSVAAFVDVSVLCL